MNDHCIAAIVSVFLLTACAQPTQPVYVATSHYDCGDTTLTVRWTQDVAEISTGGKTYRLPHARSGSGARYADETREIWEHQGELSWIDQGAARVVCKNLTER